MTTYNHAFEIAFSVSGSATTDGSDVTPEMLIRALSKHMHDLGLGDAWLEAVGAPIDTYEEPEV